MTTENDIAIDKSPFVVPPPARRRPLEAAECAAVAATRASSRLAIAAERAKP